MDMKLMILMNRVGYGRDFWAAIREIKKVNILIWVGLICLLASCSSIATEYRREGFSLLQKGFLSIEETPDLNEVVELKNVRVYIVGDRKHFNLKKAAANGSTIVGYANTRNEVHIFGRRVGDKIIVNQAILGHEINHLLHFKNPKVINPDKLKALGY